jgi:hypothetical protein
MPQWTPDQARSYTEIAAQARTAHAQARKMREKLLDKLVLEAAQRAEVPKQDPSGQSNPDIYLISRLTQVRAQLAALSLRMDEACNAPKVDAKALFALSGSYRQVQEMEQTLSGRPNPGSLRPQAPRRQAAPFTPPSDA